jgi:hypothetical protein
MLRRSGRPARRIAANVAKVAGTAEPNVKVNRVSDTAYPIGKYPPVNQDQFLALRAIAIQAYANLEMSLAILFAALLGILVDLAGLVLFRITNTHARNRILDDLQSKKHGTTYDTFWNSLISFIRTLDQRRNEIVHWHVVQNINLALDHKEAASLSLAPPTGWTTQSAASISDNDLSDFIQRCEFASRLITMFRGVVHEPAIPDDVRETWLPIFARAVTYPPSETHPLSPNYKAGD